DLDRRVVLGARRNDRKHDHPERQCHPSGAPHRQTRGPCAVGGGSCVQSGPSSIGSPLRHQSQYATPASSATSAAPPSRIGTADDPPLVLPFSPISICPLALDGRVVDVVEAVELVVVADDVVVVLDVVAPLDDVDD